MQPDQSPPWYDRLGGVDHIATVVDAFIDRIMVDDRLDKDPAVNEAHHRVSPPGSERLGHHGAFSPRRPKPQGGHVGTSLPLVIRNVATYRSTWRCPPTPCADSTPGSAAPSAAVATDAPLNVQAW
jgi:hypothetical protein